MGPEYQEFLEKLRQTPRYWYLDENRKIIRPRHRYPSCPLLELPEFTFVLSEQHLYWPIAAAADNMPGCNLAIRQDLLAACGLVERPETN